MAHSVTDQFIQQLQQAEQSGDVEPLVQLFAADAELQNPARSAVERGQEGARQFWRDYLSAFDRVHSDFTEVRQGPDFAVLEWKSDAQLPTHQPLSYRGISVLETRGPQIVRFRTYYDSAAFLPHGAKRAEGASGA